MQDDFPQTTGFKAAKTLQHFQQKHLPMPPRCSTTLGSYDQIASFIHILGSWSCFFGGEERDKI